MREQITMTDPDPPKVSEVSMHERSESVMILRGAVGKAEFLLLSMAATAILIWAASYHNQNFALTIRSISNFDLSVLFLLAVTTKFRKSWAPVTAPVLSLLAGIFLAAHTLGPWAEYPDEAIPVLAMSFGPPLVMLAVLTFSPVQPRLRTSLWIVYAIGGTLVAYLVSQFVGFVSMNGRFTFLDSSSLGLMLLTALVLALIFVGQFVAIMNEAERGVPEFLEWYYGLSLLVMPVLFYIVLINLLDMRLIPFKMWIETY
jgi:uncharacterized YccA/Bax inhibitor family protein